MVDTHTHIFDPRFDEDRQEMLQRATDKGVDCFIVPATMDDEHERMLEVCDGQDRCFPSIGLHPLAANDNPDWRKHLDRVGWFLEKYPHRFVAIGETGLDLHWDTNFLDVQKEIFIGQIELAIAYDLPLIIHTREAWAELLPIMERYAGKIRGVFHSFAGQKKEIERIEKLGGFMYGINGTITYKKSTLPDVLSLIPMDRILVETDSPYLPPEPHRGKRNESAYVQLVALKLASIKGISLEEIDKQTTRNAMKMFNLFAETPKGVSPFLNVKNNI